MKPVDSGPIPKPAETSEGTDYVVIDSPNLGNQTGRGGDRKSKEYHLTLDTAKEIAMIDHRTGTDPARGSNEIPEFRQGLRKGGGVSPPP